VLGENLGLVHQTGQEWRHGIVPFLEALFGCERGKGSPLWHLDMMAWPVSLPRLVDGVSMVLTLTEGMGLRGAMYIIAI
jgi:hypothetical protein